jgi:hypothetical protein
MGLAAERGETAQRPFWNELSSRSLRRVYRLSFGEFVIVTALAAAASLAVFAHADRRGNRHATAWGIATFLAAGIVVPLYFIRYWLRARRQRS